MNFSESSICIYSDYGCRDSSCPINKIHKSEETHFAITDVPGRCLKTIDMCSDESLDSVVRDWIGDIDVKRKLEFIPQEISDIIDCKKPKILTPLARWMRGENVKVGPGVVIPNNWKQPRIKNFIWHIRKHTTSFLYKIYVFRIFHLFYLQWIEFNYYLSQHQRQQEAFHADLLHALVKRFFVLFIYFP